MLACANPPKTSLGTTASGISNSGSSSLSSLISISSGFSDATVTFGSVVSALTNPAILEPLVMLLTPSSAVTSIPRAARICEDIKLTSELYLACTDLLILIREKNTLTSLCRYLHFQISPQIHAKTANSLDAA